MEYGLSALLIASLMLSMTAPARAQAGRELVGTAVAVRLAGSSGLDGTSGDSVADQLSGLGYAVVTSGERVGLLRAASLVPGGGAVTPIYRYRPAIVPTDTYFDEQYHHVVIGSPSAWDVTRGSYTMPIAILDTGVNAEHPDLKSKMLPGWNFHNNNANTADVHGHGTAVAGTAAAIGDNAVGVAGVAWQNPILPVSIAGADGFARSDEMAAAVHWAADHGARVINISYGPLQGDALVSAAARYARLHGALTFVAGSNEGVRSNEPQDPSILFVAATDRNDARASFSTFGPSIRLAAPGVNIGTTSLGSPYAFYSGTSFSAPLAAGAAALVWSVNPALTADQVESILLATARDLGTPGRDEQFGAGRLDVAAAVRAAAATRAVIPVIAPHPTPPPTPVTVAPRPPGPAPVAAPPLTVLSPGPNGYWFGAALSVTWQAAIGASFIQVSALVDGSVRSVAPRTAGATRGTFMVPSFATLTRGRHVLQLDGLTRDGKEVRSPAVDVLRP